MRSKPDYNKKHATIDSLGNVTAKNQHGTTVNGKPRKPKPSADGLGLGISTT